MKATIALSTLLLSSCAGTTAEVGAERGNGNIGPWNVTETRYRVGLRVPVALRGPDTDVYDPRADMINLSDDVGMLAKSMGEIHAKVENVQESQDSILQIIKEWAAPGTIMAGAGYLLWQKKAKKT